MNKNIQRSTNHATIGPTPRVVGRTRASSFVLRRSSWRYSGISLLEVLIAIAILGVGLLGIGTLLPLGQTQIAEGTVQDRATYYGRYALRQFKIGAPVNTDPLLPAAPLTPNGAIAAAARVGSMSRLEDWFAWNPTNTAWQRWFVVSGATPVAGVTAAPDSLQPTIAGTLPALTTITAGTAPICVAIDPLMIARNSGGILGGVTYSSNSGAVEQFPYGQGTQWMKRVTLFDQSTATATSTAIALAEQMFLSHDDLLFDTSNTADKKPFWPGASMSYDPSTGRQATVPPPGVVQKRPFEGNYSWMATLVPATGSDGVVVQNQFTLSVVVFYQRTCLVDHVSERQVNVPVQTGATPNPRNSGYGGMFVQFNAPGTNRLLAVSATPGEWVMLGALAPYRDDNGGTSNRQIFKWYRVVGVGSTLSTTAVPTLTLQGPDWNDAWNVSGIATATFVKGVVGVYERTIRIDSSSMWSQ